MNEQKRGLVAVWAGSAGEGLAGGRVGQRRVVRLMDQAFCHPRATPLITTALSVTPQHHHPSLALTCPRSSAELYIIFAS